VIGLEQEIPSQIRDFAEKKRGAGPWGILRLHGGIVTLRNCRRGDS